MFAILVVLLVLHPNDVLLERRLMLELPFWFRQPPQVLFLDDVTHALIGFVDGLGFPVACVGSSDIRMSISYAFVPRGAQCGAIRIG